MVPVAPVARAVRCDGVENSRPSRRRRMGSLGARGARCLPVLRVRRVEQVPFETAFTPAVEIGWRLDRPWWGHGYASEAARACLEYGFGPLGLTDIVSFTTTKNTRSRAVMERLGMTSDPAEDFDHPAVPEASPVRRHVLYRLNRGDAGPTTAS